MKRVLFVCTTDSMIWNFLIPHIRLFEELGCSVECACSVTGSFYTELQTKYSLKMHRLSCLRNPFSYLNIKALFELYKIIKKSNIDVIYCHEPVGGMLGRAVGKVCSCRVIYMVHGFHFYKGAPLKNFFLYYTAELCLSFLTDVLITINEEDYENAKKMYAHHVFKVNGVGLNLERFYQNKELGSIAYDKYGMTPADFNLLSVGELSKRKNHYVIVKALKLLNNANIHLYIVGDGELKTPLEKLSEELKLKDNVHFLGYQSDTECIYNAADIFVFPSLQEGLSVALMEAMACGLPVVCSNIRGNSDLIKNGKGGILVSNVNDEKEFASAINRILREKNERILMGLFNIKEAQNYKLQNVIEQLKDIIKNEI